MGTSNFYTTINLMSSVVRYSALLIMKPTTRKWMEVDRLKADDNEAIGNILYWNCENAVEDIRYRADEPDRGA